MGDNKAARDLSRASLETANAAPPIPATRDSAWTSTTQFTRLDILERLVVLAFYAWFFWHFATAYLAQPSWPLALTLLSESVTVFFLCIRRPAHTISPFARDWLLALGTTVIPLLIRPLEFPEQALLDVFGLGPPLLLLGMLGALASKIALGRSFGLVAAHRGLQQLGPYRIVRHPMYACYLLTHIGIWCANPTLWNLGVYVVTWTLQIARLFVEEAHLSQDPAYRAYQKAVRFRLIPGVF